MLQRRRLQRDMVWYAGMLGGLGLYLLWLFYEDLYEDLWWLFSKTCPPHPRTHTPLPPRTAREAQKKQDWVWPLAARGDTPCPRPHPHAHPADKECPKCKEQSLSKRYTDRRAPGIETRAPGHVHATPVILYQSYPVIIPDD